MKNFIPVFLILICLPAAARESARMRPEIVLQTGHSAMVVDSVFSNDGRRLYTASLDNSIREWDTATGLELRSMGHHPDPVYGLSISPDGRMMASVGRARNVEITDITTDRPIKKIPLADYGTRLAYHPDGKALAVRDSSGTIQIFDTASWLQTAARQGKKVWGNGLSYGLNGLLLATADVSGAAVILNAKTLEIIHTLRGHANNVLAVSFSRDGRVLATAGSDKVIKLWDVKTGLELRTITGHSGEVRDLAFSPDSSRLISCSTDKTVRVWDARTGSLLAVLAGHSAEVHGIAVSPDGRSIATYGGYNFSDAKERDNSIRLWDLVTGRLIRALPGDRDYMISAAFSPDLRWLAVGSSDQTAKLWELAAGRVVRTFPHKGWVKTVEFSPDGNRLATAGDECIKFWDPAGGTLLGTLPGYSGWLKAMAFSPDGRVFVKAGSGKTSSLELYDAAALHLIRSYGTAGRVSAVAFSSDSRLLAYALDNPYAIIIHDLKEDRNRHIFNIHKNVILTLAFSPDGNRLVSGSRDETAALWDLSAGKLEKVIGGYDGQLLSAVFSNDSRALVIGSAKKGIEIRNAPGWDVSRIAEGHSGWVYSVQFSRDGKWLVSASLDGTVRIWNSVTVDPAAALVSLGGMEWVVITPDGLFDGSPAGWQRIAWKFGPDVTDMAPVEIFFSEFYYPGLLSEIIAGKKPRAAAEISTRDRRQPSVAITTAVSQADSPALTQAAENDEPPVICSRTLRLNIEVAEAKPDRTNARGSGARDVRLFRNGSLVKVWNGALQLDPNGRAILSAAVPVVAGENHFTAYAFNHDNIKSGDAALTLRGADALKRSGTVYILAIGVNSYANKDYNLNFAVPDAMVFGEELRRRQGEPGLYGAVEVVPLYDRDATKANILLALDILAGVKAAPTDGSPALFSKLAPAQPEDVVFVYFSGHGVAHMQRFYLLPHDLGYAGSRSAVNESGFAEILAHGISDLEMIRAFEKIDARQLALVIDACNSGQALETDEKRRGPMNSKGLAQLAWEKGMYVLAAAQGYQAALETARLGHGYLTYALVEEGLKKSLADKAPKDGRIVLREWLDYPAERVPRMQEEAMKLGAQRGLAVYFVEGEGKVRDITKRSLQSPRVFYRREPETRPVVISSH